MSEKAPPESGGGKYAGKREEKNERIEIPWRREPDGSIVLIPIARIYAVPTHDGKVALLLRGLHPEDLGVESYQCTLSAEDVRRRP